MTSHRGHERLRLVLLDLTALTMIFAWLPFWRCVMDGTSYEWGNNYFGQMYQGAGLHGDFLFLAYQLLLGLTVLWLGNRGARAPFAALLVVWHGILAGSALHGALTAREPLMFHGDTLGVHLDITFVAPAIYGLIFLLALLWAVRETGLRPARLALRWGPVNTVLSVVVLALLGAGYYLLSTGEPHGETDGIGVVVTIVNLFVLNYALRGWHKAG
jgi:hypothetical protein